MNDATGTVRKDSNGTATQEFEKSAPARRAWAVNVGQLKRLASATVGGLLITNGFKRRSVGGAAIALTGGDLLYRGLSGHCHVYQGLGLSTAKRGRPADLSEFERSITIGKPANELYDLLRHPETLGQIISPLAGVTTLDEKRIHWRVNGPLDRTIEWDTEIVEDRPGEILRWRSIEGAKWRNEGSIRFLAGPQDWGPQVTLRVRASICPARSSVMRLSST